MSGNEKYVRLWQGGAGLQDVWRALKADERNDIDSIRIIREVCDLSFAEAKEVMAIAAGASSLSDYQAPIADALVRLIEEE